MLSHKHFVHGFLIHDPLEEGIKAKGLIEVQDSESGKQVLVDSTAFFAKKTIEQRLSDLRTHRLRASAISTADDPIYALLRHFRLQG